MNTKTEKKQFPQVKKELTERHKKAVALFKKLHPKTPIK